MTCILLTLILIHVNFSSIIRTPGRDQFMFSLICEEKNTQMSYVVTFYFLKITIQALLAGG